MWLSLLCSFHNMFLPRASKFKTSIFYIIFHLWCYSTVSVKSHLIFFIAPFSRFIRHFVLSCCFLLSPAHSSHFSTALTPISPRPGSHRTPQWQCCAAAVPQGQISTCYEAFGPKVTNALIFLHPHLSITVVLSWWVVCFSKLWLHITLLVDFDS